MLNRVELIGNLGRDPEARSMNNGGEVVTLNVATAERWKDQATGEKRERVEWHKVVIFNENLVEVAKRYLRKGSKIYIEGQLQTRKWQDQRGEDRYSTEIVLQRFRGEMLLLDKRETDPGRSDYSGHQESQARDQKPSQSPFESDLDDDVPF